MALEKDEQASCPLHKLLVEEFTKSRAYRTTDNAQVEGKNGAVVRKQIGYGPIGAEHTEEVQKFYTAGITCSARWPAVRNQRFAVKYDPRDLSRVYWRDEKGDYWSIPYRDHRRPAGYVMGTPERPAQAAP
jgi:hypothetical protein